MSEQASADGVTGTGSHSAGPSGSSSPTADGATGPARTTEPGSKTTGSVVSVTMEPKRSIEAEQAYLGALLHNNGSADAKIDPDDFFEPLHGEILKVCRRLISEGRTATPLTVAPYFEAWPEVAPGTSVRIYLGLLIGQMALASEAGNIARTIVDLAVRRRLEALGEEIKAASHKMGESTIVIASAAAVGLDTVMAQARDSKTPRMSAQDAVADLIGRLDDDRSSGLMTTGLSDLNAALGGHKRGEMAIWAGRSSMGKSAVSLSSLRQTAAAGIPCALFSLEMPHGAIAARMIADYLFDRKEIDTGAGVSYRRGSNISYSSIIKGRLDESQKKRITDAMAGFMELPIEIETERGIGMAEIAARTRRIAEMYARKNKDLGVMLIDHIGLVRPSKHYAGDRNNELGEITDGLAALAKELNIATIGLCQLNRKIEGREDKTPQMSDLRECLPGDALIDNADTGERIPIRDVVEKGLRFNVWAIDEALKVVPRPIVDGWAVGKKTMLSVLTITGRKLNCSTGHRLKTNRGWVEAIDLTPRDTLLLKDEMNGAAYLSWERIDKVIPIGEADCFDITVGDLHNFVVDGFITHNSGHIEEDAETVGGLLRPLYYLERMKCDPGSDEEQERDRKISEERHTLEFVILKQRNGETSTVKLFCDIGCNAIRDFEHPGSGMSSGSAAGFSRPGGFGYTD